MRKFLVGLGCLVLLLLLIWAVSWPFRATNCIPTATFGTILSFELILVAALHLLYIAPDSLSKGHPRGVNWVLLRIIRLSNHLFAQNHSFAKVIHTIILIVSIALAFVSLFPVIDFVKLFWPDDALPKIDSNSLKFLGFLLPFFFPVYLTAVRRQLVSPFRRFFCNIENCYYGSGEAHYKTSYWHAIGILATAASTIDNINLGQRECRIDDAGWDGCTADALLGNGTGSTALSPRASCLKEFISGDRSVHLDYIDLDRHRDQRTPLLKHAYLSIFTDMRNGVLRSIADLARGSEATTPQFTARSLIESACRLPTVQGIHATSLLTPESFWRFHVNTSIQEVSQSRPTERVSVVKRSSIIEGLTKDLARIREPGHVGLPKGIGEVFPTVVPIPFLFWMLEWHLRNCWNLFFLEEGDYASVNQGRHPPGFRDYIVFVMADHDFCIAADVENPRPRSWFDSEILYYNVTARTEDHTMANARNALSHYQAAKDRGLSVHAIVQWFEEEALTQRVPDEDGGKSLKDLLALFEQRTTSNGWVRTADDTP